MSSPRLFLFKASTMTTTLVCFKLERRYGTSRKVSGCKTVLFQTQPETPSVLISAQDPFSCVSNLNARVFMLESDLNTILQLYLRRRNCAVVRLDA